MSNYRKIISKKGQIGETVTWIPATLIIIGILLIFIGISFLMSKSKAIGIGDVKIDLGKNSEHLAIKTSMAEQLNNQNKDKIENTLREQNG